jgi:hypothetical protein
MISELFVYCKLMPLILIRHRGSVVVWVKPEIVYGNIPGVEEVRNWR